MRCCPVCYAKVKPIVSDTVMTGTKLKLNTWQYVHDAVSGAIKKAVLYYNTMKQQ